MNIVTTHTNTDFGALASLVAAAFLYPGSIRVLPSHVQPPRGVVQPDAVGL